MAVNINDVINEMDTAQAAEPALAGLNSASNVAIYTTFKRVIAAGIVMLSRLWDIAKDDLNNIAVTQIYGTRQWYVNLVLNMPSGPAAKASCIELGSKVLIKVAKLSGTSTAQLTATEVQDVRTYVHARKVVGTDLDIISQTADLCKFELSIQYTGVQATVETAVAQAVHGYLDALAFDADLSKALLIDTLLNVPGVVNAFVDVLEVNYGLGFTLILGNTAPSDAGYYGVAKDLSNNDYIALNMYL